MAATSPAAAGPPANAPPLAQIGPPTWKELLDAPECVFALPNIPYEVVSAALFRLLDPPEALLLKLECTAMESPVMIALVSDEDPDWITLLKNPRRFVGSLVHPTPLDGHIYGFSGPDARTLAAVHVPASAFDISTAYNVLDDAAAIRLGLEGLPQDQPFHPYVNVGTPNMTNSACRRTVLLPTQWHAQLAKDHPHGISLKTFYDSFLLPLQGVADQPYLDVQTWWRHAATCTGPAGAHVRSGLQVATAQALPPALHVTCDGWAQEQVERLFVPLRAGAPPLSNASFEAGMQLLRTDLAMHHAASEARELAQHADREAREDRRDAPQTFEGRFGTAKLEEVLRLLRKDSADDLPQLLQDLAQNKKKSDDALVIQMAIDNCAASPASAANEYTKPQLSTHLINLFRNYAWAATGEQVTDGITPFNLTFASETGARAVAMRVHKLVAVESGDAAMSCADAELFMIDESMFPTDTTQCGYRLEAHSIMVDLMMGEDAPFAVAYRQCMQDLRAHFELSLHVHYGELGGGHVPRRTMHPLLDDPAVPVLPLRPQVWTRPAHPGLLGASSPHPHQDPGWLSGSPAGLLAREGPSRCPDPAPPGSPHVAKPGHSHNSQPRVPGTRYEHQLCELRQEALACLQSLQPPSHAPGS